MDNQTYKYSAFFKMYGEENLQVSFNIVENDLSTHMVNLNEILDLLKKSGYTVDPKSAAEGEKIQEVTGWVLGKTSKDELCVHLYGPEHLQWKVITVWAEDMPKLPVSTSGIQPVIGGAPEREVAVKLKILHPFPAGTRIVMEPMRNSDGSVRLTDKGNPAMRFSRMYGTQAATTEKEQREESQSPLLVDDEDFYQKTVAEIESYPDIAKLISPTSNAGKIVKWCRKTQKDDKDVAIPQSASELISILDDHVQSPGAGDAILSVLSGIDVIELNDELSDTLVKKLTDWLDPGVTGKAPNPNYNQNYVKAIKEIFAIVEKVGQETA